MPPQTKGLEDAIYKLELQAHARLQDLQFARASGNPEALLAAKQRFAAVSERITRLYWRSGVLDGKPRETAYLPGRS